MRDVLDIDLDPADHSDATWTVLAHVLDSGRCVAALQVAVLPAIFETRPRTVGAIRAVAVDPAWRGRGLFRDLMRRALDWIAGQGAAPTLLYTAEPALYERFGFGLAPQHAFRGAPPIAGPRVASRSLVLARHDHRTCLEALVTSRAPLSMRANLRLDAPSILTNIANDAALQVAYSEALAMAVVFERDDDRLTLVDVIARDMPTLSQILGVLDVRVTSVTSLFAPDRLHWEATAVAEETGLMVKGHLPSDRPFMFPPTVEF